MKKQFLLWVLIFVTAMTVYGCAKQADTSKPLDQIRKEAETMSVQDLQAYAKAYAQAADKQKAEVEKVAAELKKIPLTQMFGDEAKSIKDRLGKVQSESSALMERYQIYADKVREKGGSV